MDSYGAALEADLFERGWDLLDYFRGVRPWPQLLRLVEHLPPHSHFRRALADDDDLQARIDAQPKPPRRRSGPSLRDWDEHQELRAALADGFALVQQAVGASVTPKGKSPPKFTPVRRPRTAADRAQRRREEAVHAEIVAQVLPKSNKAF